jgi:iron complex outermembrane receptor protein
VKKLYFLFSAIFMVVAAHPDLYAQQTLRGLVVDQNNQPIRHVTVISNDLERTVQTGEDGTFEANTFSQKPFLITFSHAGYIPRTVRIDPNETMPTITLTRQVYPMDGLTVTAGRAVTGQSPISFQTLDKETVDRDFDVGEVPGFLETTPNLYSFSDAGGGLGYSYLKIRGFDARRAPVYINGIPLNDPEDHSLYFVDLPDLTTSADNIQVQRGVGNSLYGDPSFGGSINILTSPLSHNQRFVADFGYGGFLQGGETVGLTRKSSIFYATGLMPGGWSISGRYVDQFSDGYRENSWYDGYAYYFSLARVDPKMITTFNLYAGPMQLHAAWDGIDRETMAIDRRTNWYNYDNETDNFNQPHYELHNIYNLSDDITLYNTLYLIKGDGYYEQLKSGENLVGYNLSDDPDVYSDLVRRKQVDKYQVGFNSQAVIEKQKHATSLGGSYYFFESEHWGEVIWAEEISPSMLNINDPARYYEYFGKYHNLSGHIFHRRQIGERLNVSGNLQLRYLHKDIHQTPIGVYGTTIYDLDWLFLSPRVGLNYVVSDNLTPYFSFSIASHDPYDDMIDDADDPNDIPRLEVIDSTSTPIKYGDPLVDPERVYDFELGTNYRSEKLAVDFNLFWMEYHNEIVPDGGVNSDGFPTVGNADRATHRGLEVSFTYSPMASLRIEGNYAYNDNWIREYDQNVEVADGVVEIIQRRDVAVPNFPVFLANFVVDYSYGPTRLVYRLRGVGRQFISMDGRYAEIGGKLVDVSIAPQAISSLKGFLHLGSVLGGADLTLEGKVDNLFDIKYETYGYKWSHYAWGDFYAYWPAAERNWFINLKLTI